MPSNSLTPDTPLAAGLYVVGTPIGNLADITLRALSVLARADLIAAEDTRHTRRLLAAHGIERPLISYHEHNEIQRSVQLRDQLREGAAIALVSNAGTPTVSDPGYRLVQAAAADGIPVVPVPGVSAVITALCAAGLPTDQFTFIGFPARKKSKRAQQLAALAALPHTLVFYQSPLRLAAFVQELIEALGDREAVLGREMTKLHEEFLRGSLSVIGAALDQRDAVKGECTLLVAGVTAPPPAAVEDVDNALQQALASGDRSLNDIAKALAARFKVGKKQIYDRALELKGRR
ncbi:16S rRNA (cytidine(1402)-2'-O)-methyltransferase [Desulfatitalea alkaliphila]|uniref:Ribosomal RNA small subunit methyltransferase I n=1 Tax=Desulfatitalea alkaliphila TaxID=2929485 RepID=A0AA41UIB7_9BACT|nr:16S rRNA (cytidine(1402)-2'-O)-methyltransferase [Desulfatitalea alkaliphila]MCJ8499437.1 16S rRNA (cytidine(1402)-2'-O)-methyltransferase [Desulfatitalea alkaliphila]